MHVDSGGERPGGPQRAPMSRWPRCTMVMAALVAGVLCGFPAASVHQEPGGRGQTPGSVAPTPPVASVLVPGAGFQDPDGSGGPPPVTTDDATPNTVPLLPAESVPGPTVSVAPPPKMPGTSVPGVAVAAPVAAPAGPIGRYSFEVINPDGSPARWNPCEAVHYLVNLTDAPPGAMVDLQHAVAILSRSTGLQFVSDGTTAAPLQTAWITSGPVGASGWPDVLIGWSDPGHTDLKLTPAMGGITEYEAASLPGGGSGLVGALVVLSRPNDPGPGFGPNSRGALLLHELGHAIGLAHVDDRTQLMNPMSTGAPGAYGSGDLAGLSILGSGACLAAPTRAQTDLGHGGS